MREYVKKYYTDGNIRYEGEAVWSRKVNDFIPDGQGKLYYGNGMLWQTGIFDNSRIIEGREYTLDGYLLFEGKFKDFKSGEIDYGYSYFANGKIFNRLGTATYKGEFDVRPVSGYKNPQVFLKGTNTRIDRTRIYYVNWGDKSVSEDLPLVMPSMKKLCGADGIGFDTPDKWTECEPYLGYSSVLALVFQERYGGDIMGGKHNGEYRFWNRIPNFGKPSNFDITGYVYNKAVRLTEIRVFDRDELLKDPTIKVKYTNIRNMLNDVIDVRLGEPYPANVLSPSYPNGFVVDGVQCASMEGFLQSLKFKSVEKQRQVCLLVGDDAKNAGKRKRRWKHNGILYWKGKKLYRTGRNYEWLIDKAFNELFHNPVFFTALRRAKGNTLICTVGEDDEKKTLLTRRDFITILNRLTARIV